MIFNTGSGGNATRIVTGKSLYLADTAGGKYKNIKLVGASVQDGTPTVSKPVDIVSNKVKSITGCGKNLLQNTGKDTERIGLTYTMQSDGTVKVVGTMTEADYQVLIGQVTLPKGSYVLSGAPNNVCRLRIAKDNNSTLLGHDLGTGYSFTLEEKTTVFVSVRTQSAVGTSVNAVYYPMIRLASISDATYEPYVSNTAELDQTYEFNGINGIYDEIDLERGVRIQRFGVKVFKGSSDENWYTMDTQLSGTKRLYTRALPLKNCTSIYVPANNILCSHYSPISASDTYLMKRGIATTTADNYLYIYDEQFNTADTSAWKAHLSSNPMTVVYELETPVETPLSVDELIAFNKLRAYKSGSSLLNSGGCDMEVEYFLNNKVGQPMADTHMNTAKYILDGATLNIIV